jgi:hypothetical protein
LTSGKIDYLGLIAFDDKLVQELRVLGWQSDSARFASDLLRDYFFPNARLPASPMAGAAVVVKREN